MDALELMPATVQPSPAVRGVARVTFWCDGSTRAGLGHVNRCVVLAAELARQGAPVRFAVDGGSPAALSRVAAAGFPVTAAAPAGATPALVVDHYGISDAVLEQCRGSAQLLCLIDDEGRRSLAAVDVLLNQNPDQPEYDDAGGTALLIGPAFALVRDEFRALRDRAAVGGERLLLTFGGSDPSDLTSRALRVAIAMPEWDAITVLVGPGYAAGAQLAALAETDSRVSLVRNPSDVARVMAGCRVAVAAAGSTCYELACLGIPFVTLSSVPNHLVIAEPLAAAGLAPDGGSSDRFDAARLAGALRGVIADRPRRVAALRSFVDGRGPERVAAALIPRLGGAVGIAPLDASSDGRLSALVALDAACVAELGDTYSNVAWADENFRRDIAGKTDLSCCALAGTEVAGFWVASATPDGDAHTHRVAVAPASRRLGVAARMFESVLRAARLRSLRRMTLEVGRGNSGARAFYERLGFAVLLAPEIARYLESRGRVAAVHADFLREADGSDFTVLARVL